MFYTQDFHSTDHTEQSHLLVVVWWDAGGPGAPGTDAPASPDVPGARCVCITVRSGVNVALVEHTPMVSVYHRILLRLAMRGYYNLNEPLMFGLGGCLGWGWGWVSVVVWELRPGCG